ncbi:MAG TPA: hypothetical protein VMT19_13105, partial [Thermoanaerobaculaceae bacterium]|nr:hypothetical protein [Thermoanaerobaculaceae bacterium]
GAAAVTSTGAAASTPAGEPPREAGPSGAATSRPVPGAGRRAASAGAATRAAAGRAASESGDVAGRTESARGGEPAPPSAPLSGVAVAVVGEEPLAGTVASLLQSEVQGAGLQALDAANLPGAEDLLRGGGQPSANDLLRSLRGSGAAVLVMAKVQRVGERTLSYMDRQDVAYSSRVTLTGYDLRTGRQKGQSRSAVVEYTQLSLEQASDKALGPLARQLVEDIR